MFATTLTMWLALNIYNSGKNAEAPSLNNSAE